MKHTPRARSSQQIQRVDQLPYPSEVVNRAERNPRQIGAVTVARFRRRHADRFDRRVSQTL